MKAIAKAKAKKKRFIAVFLLLDTIHPSARCVAAIDNEGVADHEACARAAKPKNGSGDLLRLTQSPNRQVSQDVSHGDWILSKHIGNNWRIDRPWAHRIDAPTS